MLLSHQAKKAAALQQNYADDNEEADARIMQEAKHEEDTINKICSDLSLVMHEVSYSSPVSIVVLVLIASVQINPDGHCLFAAVADQLHLLGLLSSKDTNYATTRRAASHYMFSHPDDFLPFLPSVTGEDGAGATNAGLMGAKDFEQYCATIRDTGTWGGEPEILALSRAYNVPIHVVQAGKPPIVVHDPNPGQTSDVREKGVARISYHRRMYGLGEVRSYALSPFPEADGFSSTIIPYGPRALCVLCFQIRLHNRRKRCMILAKSSSRLTVYYFIWNAYGLLDTSL